MASSYARSVFDLPYSPSPSAQDVCDACYAMPRADVGVFSSNAVTELDRVGNQLGVALHLDLNETELGAAAALYAVVVMLLSFVAAGLAGNT